MTLNQVKLYGLKPSTSASFYLIFPTEKLPPFFEIKNFLRKLEHTKYQLVTKNAPINLTRSKSPYLSQIFFYLCIFPNDILPLATRYIRRDFRYINIQISLSIKSVLFIDIFFAFSNFPN